ncbi:MAG TPA: SDR family NAD(P)-dependent oxidoreductase [Thermoanaerobaculia bacterium]|nr:SDR family NAD(P)-dependent oxidoreductase [Thermoanaerobaculia bacterium]
MTAVVVGASAGLGRALAVELARSGRPLLLVASDRRDLDALAGDLSLRFGVAAKVLALDAADADALAAGLRAAAAELPPVEALLLPIGTVDDGDTPLLEPARARRLIDVNFTAPAAAVRELLPGMLERHRGAVVGFGSVAAARGRSRNAVYAAAKRALASYFESLRHLAEPAGVAVAFYVLGYLDTRLAFGRRLLLPKGAPTAVARRVVRRLGRDRGVGYLPRFWYPLVLALKALPHAVYGRLDF